MPPWLVPLAWSGLLALNAAVLAAFDGGTLPVALLGGAAAAAALLAAILAARHTAGGAWDATPALSAPAALAAVGVAGLVLGAELGTWLVLISAGVLALAVAGLAREARRS